MYNQWRATELFIGKVAKNRFEANRLRNKLMPQSETSILNGNYDSANWQSEPTHDIVEENIRVDEKSGRRRNSPLVRRKIHQLGFTIDCPSAKLIPSETKIPARYCGENWWTTKAWQSHVTTEAPKNHTCDTTLLQFQFSLISFSDIFSSSLDFVNIAKFWYIKEVDRSSLRSFTKLVILFEGNVFHEDNHEDNVGNN